MRSRLLIFTALQYEASSIAKALRIRERSGSAGGDADGPAIALHVIGPGACRLPEVRDATGIAGIIMAGLAGGLDPTLRTGDVVVDAPFDVAEIPVQWRRGTIATADKIVTSPEQKAALFRTTGALVVDMENAVVRRFAAELGVPFMGIRAVTDRADEVLDPALLYLIAPSGRLRPLRLLAQLCRRPSFAKRLLHAGSRSRVAMLGLIAALQPVIRRRSASEPW